MDPTRELGQRLRARRSELGLTLAQVAQEAGLSLPYVANLEKGRGNPTLDVVVGLAGALQVQVADLFADDPPSEIDLELADLPPVLIDFGRGQIMAERVRRLAKLAGLGEEETRISLLASMARLPRRRRGTFSLTDCQRYLDAVQLILDNHDGR